MKKKFCIIFALLLLIGALFVGCAHDKATEIYFLNFKPEIAEIYEKEIVPAFEAENPGYKLKVVTAASGTYEQTFNSEVAKSNPPVIFQVNGPIGLKIKKMWWQIYHQLIFIKF